VVSRRGARCSRQPVVDGLRRLWQRRGRGFKGLGPTSSFAGDYRLGDGGSLDTGFSPERRSNPSTAPTEGTFEVSHSTRTLATSAVAVVALGLTLSACSEDAASNEADACSAITDFRAAVSEIGSVTADSTVDEIREVREDVQTAYRDLVTTLDDVADDRFAELDDAYDAFDDSVDDLPEGATLAEAAASLQEEAAAIESAQTAVADELSCD
jgi:hypothetical protein